LKKKETDDCVCTADVRPRSLILHIPASVTGASRGGGGVDRGDGGGIVMGAF
jgi:hypothetical protein